MSVKAVCSLDVSSQCCHFNNNVCHLFLLIIEPLENIDFHLFKHNVLGACSP